jgi:hypothetical protein
VDLVQFLVLRALTFWHDKMSLQIILLEEARGFDRDKMAG